MKKALVLGASGGMGSALVYELVRREIEVAAFARRQDKLEKLFGKEKEVNIVPGDLFRQEDILRAAEGVDVIFHAANIPYPEWQPKLFDIMKNVLDTAGQVKAKVAIVDNIYAYGKGRGEKITEDYEKTPHTKKGKIRLELEKLAKNAGIPVVIAHFPDFYGPGAENTLLHYMFQAIIKNKKAMYVGSQKIAREFIFTPDGAKALVELSLREDAYGENWNIPGTGVITGEDIINIVKGFTGYDQKVGTVSKNMIRLIGIVDRNMREYVEMYYLNESPVVLNGSKYERNIGPLPATPYKDGFSLTLSKMLEDRQHSS